MMRRARLLLQEMCSLQDVGKGLVRGLSVSLPELMDFKLFGKTILVVRKRFRLFLASQLGK